MGASAIEWTEKTWNPVVGCTRVSAGCDNCYAVRMSHRMEGIAAARKKAGTTPVAGKWADYDGLTVLNGKGDRHFNGVVRCLPERLVDPLRWRKPSRIFVNSMSDLFHESVPFEFIDKVFAVMALCPQHTFQVLTKRPERMAEWTKHPELAIAEAAAKIGLWKGPTKGWTQSATCGDRWIPPYPLPNVWLGTSCEDQKTLDERWVHLAKCPAAVRFLSLEPLLGPIKIAIPSRTFPDGRGGLCCNHCCNGDRCDDPSHYDRRGCPHCLGTGNGNRPDWVIVGGESGPGARPMHPDWVRSIRDQCQAAGVPFFFKQWGEWTPIDEPWKQESPKPCGERERWMNLVGGHGFHGEAVWRMRRVGKKAAGRVLDGRLWDEYPKEMALA